MVVLFLPKKTRIYNLHMRSSSKRGSDLGNRLMLQRAFQSRKARVLYKIGIRWKKIARLYLQNQ